MATLDAQDKEWIASEIRLAIRQQFAPSGEAYGRMAALASDQRAEFLATPITLSDGSTMTVSELYMVIRRHEKQYRLIEGLTPA